MVSFNWKENYVVSFGIWVFHDTRIIIMIHTTGVFITSYLPFIRIGLCFVAWFVICVS